MNLNTTHLIWTTIANLLISHLGAKYLSGITPRGYWFWFTILSIFLSLLFL